MSMLYWHEPGPGLVPVMTWRPERDHCSVVGYASPATTPLGVLVMFSFGMWCEAKKIQNEWVIRVREAPNGYTGTDSD